MKNENLNKTDKDDTPWYVRLILGIVFILFIVTTFFYYNYIIDQLARLVPSWMDNNFRRYLSSSLLFSFDQFRSVTFLH